jgi:SH3-like domain-containing protein
MRLLLAFLLGSQALAVAASHGEQTFPYKTSVASEDVYVRSGPGQNYYPTDKLRRGQEVEVYRHDPGGWCAIRPVDGSFAWISGRYLKPTDDHLAVVLEDGVSARVGSRFSDIREVVQVRLRKGESVEILEEPADAGRGSGGWFKIAPPSGEFRWVSAKYLDADYPRDGVRTVPRDEPAENTSPCESAPLAENAPPIEQTAAAHGDSTAPRIPEAALVHTPSGEAADDSFRGRSTRRRSLTAEEYDAELARLELELSVMVIEEPTVWSFDSLRQRSNLLLDQAQTAVERGRARMLANKIARFDDIKQRQDMVLAMRDKTDRNSHVLAKLRPDDGTPRAEDGRGNDRKTAQSEMDGRFDGVGQLTQVVSPKPGAPRYALVDGAGDVQCYVTPVPGVPMHNYIGRRVGVTGNRGYVPEQRASHIMARHITPLENPLVR